MGSSGDGNLDRGGIHRLHDQKLRWFTDPHKSAPHTFWCSLSSAAQDGIVVEARLVERAFGIAPCALTEVLVLLQDCLASAET